MTLSGRTPGLLAGLLALMLAGPCAQAQNTPEYPTRPVTIVVPFAVGGGTDILARMVALELEQRLRRSFIIENKPGAGRTPGAAFFAAAQSGGSNLRIAPSTPPAGAAAA